MGPEDLRIALSGFEPFTDPNILYGTNAGDDTGVYKLREDLALVQTVDFFTPIVDDPYDYGQIAAANALSDCFTMGAQPVTGLNLVAFPCDLGLDILGRVMAGGADKTREAGAVIIGGHSVDDPEPKFGMAVTGVVDPRKMITNRGAKPGDKLVLTKKIGTGIITNVTKAGNPLIEAAKSIFGGGGKLKGGVFEEAVASMKALNRKASEVMQRVGVNACTDITGFGLVGHLHNVMEASRAAARIRFSEVPQFDDLLPHAMVGTAGGGERNRYWTKDFSGAKADVSEEMIALLNDAQTSGGLMMAVSAEKAAELIRELRAAGATAAAIIGEVIEGAPGRVEIEV
ncbi:MAG: selenide, water dikinase SelD [bacterium]|nr:selenide, water dikinase SelD [bacterium]